MKKSLEIIFAILLIIFAAFLFFKTSNNSPISTEVIKESISNNKTSYNNTLITFPLNNEEKNPRYLLNEITYSFNNKTFCGNLEVKRIEKAFFEIQNQTDNVLSFTEVNENGSIKINCSKYLLKSDTEGYFISGNAVFESKGDEITKGEINLYNCKENTYPLGCASFPDVEIHEILHTFGIGHIDNSSSIMNEKYTHCNYKIDSEIIDYLIKTYTNEA
jgi:uncharacterized protein YxeA